MPETAGNPARGRDRAKSPDSFCCLIANSEYTQSMSKRLQVLLPDHEFAEIRGLAARERLTVAAWVRRALDEAKRRQPGGDPAQKVAAIRAAVSHEFPSGDITTMLAEIDRGVVAGQPAVPPVTRRQRRSP